VSAEVQAAEVQAVDDALRTPPEPRRITAKERTTKKRALRRSIDHAVLESQWSELIGSLLAAVDAVNEFRIGAVESADGKYTQARALKGLLGVTMAEVIEIEDIHRRAKHRRRKHEQCRAALGHYVAEVLEDGATQALVSVGDADDVQRQIPAVRFVRETVRLIEALHLLLNEDTPPKKRARVLSGFYDRCG